MNPSPERINHSNWYRIEIGPVSPTDRQAGKLLTYETQAFDNGGAKHILDADVINLALSREVEPNRLVASVTPCKDC